MKFFFYQLFLIFLFSGSALSYVFGQNAVIQGTVKSNGQGLPDATVVILEQNFGTVTDSSGFFSFRVNAGNLMINFQHVNFKLISRQLTIGTGDTVELSVVMEENIRYLDQVQIIGNKDNQARLQPGIIKIDPETAKYLPSAFNDFSKILVTLPGVISNNELSSSYSVRGGNFDENLVYVNDIPVYRPFLVRAGQQEGLSFVNPDMVSDVSFSSGGWQAKYGDKLSSSLNVNYKKPTKTAGSATLGLLGGGLHAEGNLLKNRLSYVVGGRYKTSQYLLNTLDTKGQYLPRFVDIQSYLNYKFKNNKTELGLLLSYANNRYLVRPEDRTTTFGTLDEPFRLFIAYQGQETLTYNTLQSGLKLTHRFTNKVKSDLIVSGVSTREREYFDLISAYRLCDINISLGGRDLNRCARVLGVGANYDYARNRLDATIINVINRNTVAIDTKNTFEFGLEYSHEKIDDFLQEYSFSDSADYVHINETVNNQLILNSDRFVAYAQNTTEWNEANSLTLGVRLNYWNFNNQLLVSPRAQYSIKPNWDRDIVFRLAAGLYQQPPFYREFRNQQGEINREIKAQSSVHGIVGFDYKFRWFGREFTFLTEAYYKYLYNVIPYDVENVRIRYFAENMATAYAAGVDFRINGEFIPGAESWFSLGILKTEEDIEGDGKGYIRRPSDQRINLGVFFQDHFPNDPSLRVYLSAFYATGLPFGPPNRPEYRNFLDGPSYTRVDIGFSKQVLFQKNQDKKGFNLRSRWLGLEVLNLLGNDNTISYTWVTDVNSRQYAVPNRLSTRFITFRIIARY